MTRSCMPGQQLALRLTMPHSNHVAKNGHHVAAFPNTSDFRFE
ncbi:MAG: hypothetical protein ACK4KV_07735 [Rhodocyclaceae bacterium]